MPATNRRNRDHAFVLGVDGCPKGWLAVRLYPHRDYPQPAELLLFETFCALMRSDWGQARLIMVDIPIGLADEGRRGCDRLARQLLGPKRGTSVFSAPRRPMLSMQSYSEANAWGKHQGKDAGGGLSKQAWNIVPKIRDVDQEITPARQKQIREAHPEVAFHRLNRQLPVVSSKRTPAGLVKRKDILCQNGLSDLDRTWHTFEQSRSGSIARQDDFLDACAIALTGSAILLEAPVHHLTAGKKDARGLIMEIWG